MSGDDVPGSLTVASLRARRRLVEEQIVAAGGSPDRVTIVAVTKTFPVSVAAMALEAGFVDLGENYAQELGAKAAELGSAPMRPAAELGSAPMRPAAELGSGRMPARWHFIGGLQRNKVKKIAPFVALWQTVDRADLAREIAGRSPGASVLVQVNTTAEAQKSGVGPTDVAALVEICGESGLDVRGLMTIGPTDGSDPRPSFALLRSLADHLGLVECSMGMSGDLEAAVAEGSTMVRIGTALFGHRA